MTRLHRVLKFSLVGVMATLVHMGVLLIFLRFNVVPTGWANVIAFVTAFAASTTFQQQFTFADRLAGQGLKKRTVLILFLVNAGIAYGLGSLIKGPFLLCLALVPALINYTMLHFFTGHPSFKR
jgi:putative flippase GtrA